MPFLARLYLFFRCDKKKGEKCTLSEEEMMVNQPKESTPFMKLLGIRELGKFNKKKREYTLTIYPGDSRATSHFGTVHGGYIAGVFDDAFGMLSYYIYGVNAATTRETYIKFHKMLKIRSEEAVIFQVSVLEEADDLIEMKGVVKKGKYVIATSQSVWKLRKNR